MIRNIALVFAVLLTTSCAAKYQSFVEGSETADAVLVEAAITDLVGTYRSTRENSNETILLHPAEDDALVMPLLESHLREEGYAVRILTPAKGGSGSFTEKIDTESDGVDLGYRASFIDGQNTYCLGMHSNRQLVCRVYESGKPASAITTKGIELKKASANSKKGTGDSFEANITEDPLELVKRMLMEGANDVFSEKSISEVEASSSVVNDKLRHGTHE